MVSMGGRKKLKLKYPPKSRISFEELDLFLDDQARGISSESITISMTEDQLHRYLILQNKGLGNSMSLKQADFCGVKITLDNLK